MNNEIEIPISRYNALMQERDKLQSKLAAIQRSLQQIVNLDPNNFNAANQAVQMAKTALLIPIPRKDN